MAVSNAFEIAFETATFAYFSISPFQSRIPPNSTMVHFHNRSPLFSIFTASKPFEDLCGICVGLDLGHYFLDAAVFIYDKGRTHDAKARLAVHLLLLPDAV